MSKKIKLRSKRAEDVCLVGIFAAIITISAYIQLPLLSLSMTLQVFAVYLTLFVLGEKKGILTVLVYILMGLAGIPVFSGFSGGIGVILGKSGGFIIGFLPALFVCSRLMRIFGTGIGGRFISALLSMIPCYVLGSVWFCFVFMGEFTLSSYGASLLVSVLPYIIPDALKILASVYVGRKLERISAGVAE